ncbi:head GIN domain-containing protein [Alterisphingorhabdus coralli]|uniref:Head GIN domain-containing protein n=1 Tax=Alterisphingorhabdus coralli TaxID=3071408 RepID=A0AA97F8J0_9SPHN|nr:head GIN domain-containing protein [Parasphingorhabdus sp. SCSIO 66989]WOE75247.1 head GIN domain-containing protein [Parasphingorhabdus sp. SCSIO 66989]
MNPSFRFLGTLAFGALSTLALSACVISIDDDDVRSYASDDGYAPVIGETVTTAAFDRVSLEGPDKLVIVRGDTPSWMVSGENEDVRNLRIEVDGDTLRIRRIGNRYYRNGGYDPANIIVTAPVLSGFSVAGSGDATITEMIGESAAINIAGSGKVTVGKVNVSQLDVQIAGSGRAILSGGAGLMNLSVAGSGDLRGADLSVSRAAVSVAGSGDAEFTSDGEVDASVIGSGDVVVRGNAICNSDRSGSGTVRCG